MALLIISKQIYETVLSIRCINVIQQNERTVELKLMAFYLFQCFNQPNQLRPPRHPVTPIIFLITLAQLCVSLPPSLIHACEQHRKVPSILFACWTRGNPTECRHKAIWADLAIDLLGICGAGEQSIQGI